ncbi:MAG TPA: EAL domain-containing protein [Thermoanaerobaculia bacterium]|nr:EAL domain-containing protein [Thermoanaerobaculia bacterium]
MQLFSPSITRRVTLIVVFFTAMELALLGLTLRGQQLLAAMGGFGGALRDWSAARQEAVYSLREYAKSGTASDLESFESSVERIRRLGVVRQEVARPLPSLAVIERALLDAGSHPDDVEDMARATRWVKYLPDYDAAMMSWAAFDHQIVRLVETAEDLRHRREHDQPARVEDTLARIDRHDRLLRQVGEALSASLSASSRWVHQRLVVAEVVATVSLCLAGVSLALVLLGRVRRSERARADGDQRYAALVTQDAVGIWQHSREGRVLFASPALLRMFGVDRLASMRPWERFFTAQDLDVIRRELEKQLDGVASTYEVEIQPVGSKERRRLLISGSPVADEHGVVQSIIGTCIDISERSRVERALADSESRLRLIMGQMPAFLWTTDRALRYTFALGRSAEHGMPLVLGRTVDQVFGAGPEAGAGAAAHRRALQGESVTFEHTVEDRVYQSHVEPLRDGEGTITGTIGVSLDITERKNFEARLSYLATRDPLTDLFNRRRFEQELDREVVRTVRSGGSSALLWCDLDRFKEINDTLGHHAGDELLIHVAQTLRQELRAGEILGRLGGDEFGVLVPGASRREAELLAKRLLEVVSRDALEVGGRAVHATASIGIVVLPTDGDSAEEVLSHADLAMYQAKREGRNRYSVFALESEARAVLGSQLATAELLRGCLRDDRLVLHMQPIVALSTGEVARWEALVRLPGHDGSLLEPASFLGVAERFGLARDIDRWVVARAVELIRRHERRGERIVVAVNLSAVWLADDELAEVAEEMTTEAGIDPASLVFEIKERAAVRDPDGAKRLIDRLVTLGAQVAVDDYGLGFSSFDLFRRLQVRYLKIDGSFIRGLGEDSVNRALVRAMIDMAHTLGMGVVAEFVDSSETVTWLTEQGCDFGEGWFLGRARPIEELQAAAWSGGLA